MKVEQNIKAIQDRLGIPSDAANVLIFGETSHWDPNWLLTSEQYYNQRIEKILDEVIEELDKEPRRVFSIECLFFFQLYWERRPDRRDDLRRLVRSGRLKLSGTGITTPDTLLPDTEAILRDYLHGQEWLRRNGLEVEPTLAYLPDDFGHSPALPSILRALGFEKAGITRIDGMYFIGSDYRLKSKFPLPGSSAELLSEKLKTLDFVWRAPDGSEVLCHWNAFTYFQGDMLAHLGIIRWMGKPLSFSWRTGRHVARRIKRFARQLRPVSRTRYMFCPMGCDFNGPVRNLVSLLDRYNRTRFPDTGIWTVCAGLEDYLSLIGHYREDLPTLSLDPNPYWMGFYASRPEAKYRSNRITRKLLVAEKLSARALLKNEPPNGEVQEKLDKAWDLTVVANHHDFITGTSPDRVWHAEQLPWLEKAERLADEALSGVRADCAEPRVCDHADLPFWTLDNGLLRIISRHYQLELSEDTGGCITSLARTVEGRPLLAGPANDLVAYRCSGGLWRMGHEYLGGRFDEISRASALPARITAEENDGLLEVRVESVLAGRPVTRILWFIANSPFIRMQVVGSAAKRVTVTCRFPTVFRASGLEMDVPGGVLERPKRKLYDPTFWPARSFVHLKDRSTKEGMAAFLGGPACASLMQDGAMEWVALRNVPREKAFGILPVLAHPATGTDPDEHFFDYAVRFTENGDCYKECLPAQAGRVLLEAGFPPDFPELAARADTVVTADRGDVVITALKRADRGSGFIARVFSLAPRGTPVRLSCPERPVRKAALCDARERDLGELKLKSGKVEVPVMGSITSVRIEF